MSNTLRRIPLGLAAVGMTVVLAGCPGDYEGGYDKVPFRERGTESFVAAPDPPPVIAGFGSSGAAEVPTLAAADMPAGVTQEMVESGAELFGTVCSACHGPGGVGTGAGPRLADTEWIHITGAYEEIVATITSGVPNPEQFPGAMPPMGGGNFTPDQVRELGAYVFALSRGPA